MKTQIIIHIGDTVTITVNKEHKPEAPAANTREHNLVMSYIYGQKRPTTSGESTQS